jgi:hypothetical protein
LTSGHAHRTRRAPHVRAVADQIIAMFEHE